MAQSAVFITDTDNEYNVTEKIIYLMPLKPTTKSLVLYETLKITFKRFFLTFVSIPDIPDDTLLITGKEQ